MVDCLQADIIKAAVVEKGMGIEIVIHQRIDSTNSWSLSECKSGRALPFACFAEEQTQGRGRRGKQWLMSAQSNIAMSLSWHFDLSKTRLHLLPLSVAMAVVGVLESIGLKQVQIKWPNDVLVRGRKIAGILIETQPLPDKQTAVVIGVGLNFKMPGHEVVTVQDGNEVCSQITDIIRETSEQGVELGADRTKLSIQLLHNMTEVVQGYMLTPDYYLDKFRRQYDYCNEKDVDVILDDKTKLSGVAKGITEQAELMVEIDGKLCVFNSAEISVKV